MTCSNFSSSRYCAIGRLYWDIWYFSGAHGIAAGSMLSLRDPDHRSSLCFSRKLNSASLGGQPCAPSKISATDVWQTSNLLPSPGTIQGLVGAGAKHGENAWSTNARAFACKYDVVAVVAERSDWSDFASEDLTRTLCNFEKPCASGMGLRLLGKDYYGSVLNRSGDRKIGGQCV